MNKIVVVAMLALVAVAPAVLAREVELGDDSTIRAGVVGTAPSAEEVKSLCMQRCAEGRTEAPPACVAECVAKSGVVAPRDAASGLPTGKRQHEPIRIIKEVGKATPKLAECKASCSTKFSTDEGALSSCNAQCVAEYDVKAPRDSASGQATGKRTSEDCDDADDSCSPEARRESMRLKMEDRKAEFEKRKTELQSRLSKFKDQKKAEVVSRISENVNKLNETLVERANKQIDKLEEVLGKVKVAAGDVNGDGTPDVAATEIAAAQAALDAAVAAVAAQASSVVAITVADESTVGKSVSGSREAFKAAWDAVFAKIKKASLEVRASYDLAVAKKV